MIIYDNDGVDGEIPKKRLILVDFYNEYITIYISTCHCSCYCSFGHVCCSTYRCAFLSDKKTHSIAASVIIHCSIHCNIITITNF